MKKFKLSKFLFLFLGVAFFLEMAPSRNVNAVAATQYNRSVREMMARRRGVTVGDVSSSKEVQQAAQPTFSPVRTSVNSGLRTSVATTTYAKEPAYHSVASTNTFLASLFSAPNKDGSLFPGGPCKNCHKSGPIIQGGSCTRCLESGPLVDTGPCEKCKIPELLPEPLPEPAPAPAPVPMCQPTYAISYNDYIVQALARDCCAMAPIYLEHVDFNLFADEENVTKNKMGNYRFRIFGCRRYDKEAVLNHGRLMEKNMHFAEIFEHVTGDCYNIVPMPTDICLKGSNVEMPEYILTAEITNFFMNVCDGYDYDNAKATNKRSGTSEMTVRWRLSNPSKTKIVWEGETTGYADLNLGQFDGEIALVHAAFADATENLKVAHGFEDQLMTRLTPEELDLERDALIDEEAALNPTKCRFAKALYQAKQCELTRMDADINHCPAVLEKAHETKACPPCGDCPAEKLPCGQPVDCPEGAACAVNEPCGEELVLCEGEGCVETLPCGEGNVDCQGGVSGQGVVTEGELNDCGCGACAVPVVPEEKPVVEENSGIQSDYTILDNCLDESGEVISGGDCMEVDDTWVETSSKEEALESLCITARKPYDTLTPENLYKLRASVVEISNMTGKKGSGLVVSDEFVLTSADLVDNENNFNKIRTINGREYTAHAVRVNPSKNTALLMLDIKTEYKPLSLELELPKSGETGFMTLGMLDVDSFDNGTENYLDNKGKVLGYRYSDDKGSEIIVDTRVQDLVIGSVLINDHGSIVGMAHTGQKTDSGKDLFLPTEIALRSLGLTICDYVYEEPSPFRQTVYKPVTELILHSDQKAPEHLKKKERK